MEEMDFKFDFEKLKVYQKSLDFIHEIFKIYKRLPREYKYTVGGKEITNMLFGLIESLE